MFLPSLKSESDSYIGVFAIQALFPDFFDNQNVFVEKKTRRSHFFKNPTMMKLLRRKLTLTSLFLSSIVFEVIRTISIFLRKKFERKKALKRKTSDFHPLKSFCAREKLLHSLFFVRLFLFC